MTTTLQTVDHALESWPVLAVLLGVILRAGLAWQKGLTWPEYRAIHRARRWVFIRLDGRTDGFDSWVNDKGGRGDPEFIATVDMGLKATAKRLKRDGGSYHVLSSIKRRMVTRPEGSTYSDAHVIFDRPGGNQVEAYLFDNGDGTTDLYSHVEPSPSNPADHLGGDKQTPGDSDDVVKDALEIK